MKRAGEKKGSDWVVEAKDRGIYLPQVDLWMDPQRPQKRALVSHAHYDHLAAELRKASLESCSRTPTGDAVYPAAHPVPSARLVQPAA